MLQGTGGFCTWKNERNSVIFQLNKKKLNTLQNLDIKLKIEFIYFLILKYVSSQLLCWGVRRGSYL